MSLTNGKCPNCNAPLKFESGKDTVTCEYCRTTVFVSQFSGQNTAEKTVPPPVQPQVQPPPVQNPPPIWPSQPNHDPWNINPNANRKIPPRPVINPIIVLVLAFMYVFPAVIYIAAVAGKQKEWDNKYAKK